MFINCGLRKLLHVDFFIALLLLQVLRYIYHPIQNYLSKSFSFLSRGVSVKNPLPGKPCLLKQEQCTQLFFKSVFLNYIIYAGRPLHISPRKYVQYLYNKLLKVAKSVWYDQ
jgi:hypothetical protein